MSFHIQKATIHDAAMLRELGIKTFEDTFAKYNTPENMKLYLETGFAETRMMEELRDKKSTFLLAYDNDTVVGYVKLRDGHVPDELAGVHAIEIERLYSIKEYIGRHVGRLLMNASLALATEQGYAAAWLGVWEHNARAIAFYSKHGFTKFGEHIFMLGHDVQTDWMMKKIL